MACLRDMAWSSRRGIDDIEKCSNGRIIKEELPKEILEEFSGDFNCGSFALGMKYWYLPYDDCGDYESDELDEYTNRYCHELFDWKNDEETNKPIFSRDYYDACTGRGQIMVDYMVETLPFVREVRMSRELKDDEYLVLFRASAEDFHFIRRMSDGTWAHKQGGSPIETVTKEKFPNIWRNRIDWYSGKVFKLAVKKEHSLFENGYDDEEDF